MSARTYFAWRMLAEAESADAKYEQRRYGARMRAQMDHLRFKSDKKFIKLYRLSKEAFVDLLKRYTELRSTQRIYLEAKVLCALLFYAKGGYQCSLGEANNVSQETMSVYIREVTKALIHTNMVRRFLRFPTSRRERDNIKQRDAVLTPVQETNNDKHSKARVIIENTFGRLKNRWRCCIKYRALHYGPTKCSEIIMACTVLHNIAVEYNVPDPDDDDGDIDTFVRQDVFVEPNGNDLLIGKALLRDQLARRLAS